MIKKEKNKFHFMNFKNLGVKLNLSFTLIILLIFITLFSFMAFQIYSITVSNTKELLTADSKNYANEISEVYIQNLQSAKDLEIRVYNNINTGASREKIIQAIKDAMDSNENIYGVGLCFEPNAFDGKDSEYADKSYFDATGRFIPYVTESSNGYKITGLVNYDKEETKWYQIPKKTNKITVTEPFIQESNGKNLLLSTLSIPLKDSTGKFIGTLTLDSDITSYQEIIKDIDIENGYTSIISAEGNFVAHSTNPNMIMKNISSIDVNDTNQIGKKIANGEEFILDIISPETGEKMLRISVPIYFAGTDVNWSLSSVIPYKTFLGEYYDLLIGLIFIIILAIIVQHKGTVLPCCPQS